MKFNPQKCYIMSISSRKPSTFLLPLWPYVMGHLMGLEHNSVVVNWGSISGEHSSPPLLLFLKLTTELIYFYWPTVVIYITEGSSRKIYCFFSSYTKTNQVFCGLTKWSGCVIGRGVAGRHLIAHICLDKWCDCLRYKFWYASTTWNKELTIFLVTTC